jgi:transposase
MANHVEMAILQAIQQLHAAQWSQRRIALELNIDRGTVARHLRQLAATSKAAILPAGSPGPNAATSPGLPGPGENSSPGSDPENSAAGSKAAIPPPGSPGVAEAQRPLAPCARAAASTRPAGRASQCAPHRDVILAKLNQQLSAQRIWQDLVTETGFTGCYDSVKRFVRRLAGATPLPFRRLECRPGEEAQVDFGTGAPLVTPEGKRRKTHVFRIILSHSRKGYSEATLTQTTEDFFRALENAFAHFGGVPETLIIDNLKAAVAHPDWFDPVLTPKVQSFCAHYGTVILPTKPYTPRHKGKVEAGVKYVQSNALKRRTFTSLEQQNEHLADWERTIADTRIHGTTKRQVGKLFAEAERAALRSLPRERFPSFHEARRKVNRDGHVEVAKAYYSAPPEYLGREVWVRWDARLVRLFNQRWEQLAIHVRREPGKFSTLGEHVAKEKISGLERGVAWLLAKAGGIGPQTQQWAQAMIHARGIEGTRVLQGLLALTKKHPPETLEKACETALSHGAFRLKTLRTLLARQGDQPQAPLPFLDEHPIIRPLDDYAAVVAQALQRQTDRPSGGEGFERHDWAKTSAGNAASPHGAGRQGSRAADLSPPRSEYPSPGRASAEPGSVSPDVPIVVPPSSFHQEPSNE